MAGAQEVGYILYRQYLNMRSLRKEIKVLSSLAETVLQYRLNPYSGLAEHLSEMRKKIRQMSLTQNYEQGIAQMLVSKENYQIRNKVSKYEQEQPSTASGSLCIQIRISAIEKCSCQKYNQQLWQFGVQVGGKGDGGVEYNQGQSIVELIQYVLKFLVCYSVLPLNKQYRNRYMLDYRVSIGDREDGTAQGFENMACQEVLVSRTEEGNVCKLETKYFFNEGKVQQSLKQIIISKSLEMSGNSKKNSSDTTDSLKRVSLYQFYDDELDITVLSGSDFSSENGEEIEVQFQNWEEEDQFQMLIEETLNDDELFLRSNLTLFKDLASHDYF